MESKVVMTNTTLKSSLNRNWPIKWFALVALLLLASKVPIHIGDKATEGSNKSHLIVAQEESSFDRIRSTRILRAGYSVFKPYTIETFKSDKSKPQVTGFSADLITEIAARQTPPWKVEWHKISWESLLADMESGRFDVLVDPVYQTIPRAAQFTMSKPYSYFGVAIALVRIDETRFTTFTDLDRDDIRISLADGWTSTEFALAHLKKPKFNIIPVGDDPFVQFQDVTSGRTDVALQDVPTVIQFVRAHVDSVKALWIDYPPTTVGGGFIMRRGETALKEFLDTCINILETDGTIEHLDQKWQTLGEFVRQPRIPGSGLSPTRDSKTKKKEPK